MEATGAENARQLAQAIGFTGIDDDRRVRRWITGENTPDFAGTMALLSAAGLLRPRAERGRAETPPLRDAQTVRGDAAVLARLQSLEERVGQLATQDDVKLGFAALEAAIEQQAEARTRGGSRGRKRAAG